MSRVRGRHTGRDRQRDRLETERLGEIPIHSERQTTRDKTDGEKREAVRDRKNKTDRKIDSEEGTGHPERQWFHLLALTNVPAPGLLTLSLARFHL